MAKKTRIVAESRKSKVRQLVTSDADVIKAAREKSAKTGISISHVAEAAWRLWVAGKFDPTLE